MFFTQVGEIFPSYSASGQIRAFSEYSVAGNASDDQLFSAPLRRRGQQTLDSQKNVQEVQPRTRKQNAKEEKALKLFQFSGFPCPPKHRRGAFNSVANCFGKRKVAPKKFTRSSGATTRRRPRSRPSAPPPRKSGVACTEGRRTEFVTYLTLSSIKNAEGLNLKKAHLPPWVPVQGDYCHVVVERLVLHLVQVVAGEVSDLASRGGGGGGGVLVQERGVEAFQGYSFDFILCFCSQL